MPRVWHTIYCIFPLAFSPNLDYNRQGTNKTQGPRKETPMSDALAIALELFAKLPPDEQREIIALALALASQQ